METRYEIEFNGYNFSLVSYGYQFEASAEDAKSARLLIDIGDLLDEDTRIDYLAVLDQVCEIAQHFDLMVKASEFVTSELAEQALETWESGRLHGHALICDAAIYISKTEGFPLSKEIKKKLRMWNKAAAAKIYEQE